MSAPDPENLDLPTLAWLAGAAANEHLLARVRAAGHPEVRLAHGYVFQYLLAEPRSIGELAELLGVTQQAASKSVLELESLGYVARAFDAHDSRVRRVALTERGHQLVACGRIERAKLEAELAERLGARTLKAARRALSALLEASGGRDAVRTRRVRPPRL